MTTYNDYKMKIKINQLPQIRDAIDFELLDEKSGIKAYMTVTGVRMAVDRQGTDHYINLVKQKFMNDIQNKRITKNDTLRYCFYGDGDFTKTEKGAQDIEIKSRVSKYGDNRLHIEIPKGYVELFHAGDEVVIKKIT